jgi:hypothetical protein
MKLTIIENRNQVVFQVLSQVWPQVKSQVFYHKFSTLSFNIETFNIRTFNIRTDINYKINMLLNKWILYNAKQFLLYKHSTNLNKEILCEGIHNTLNNKG